jgi:ribosomally synthesized peptide (two-chain TOMM family)
MNLETKIYQTINGKPMPSYETFIEYRGWLILAIADAWRDKAFSKSFAEDPAKALKDRYGYEYPYGGDLTCDKDSAEYTPHLANDWHALTFCSITLQLPPAPEKEEDRALALANYNLHHLIPLQTRMR